MQAVLKVFVSSSYLNRRKLGALEPHATWGDVCGSEISKYSWNDELVVYIIDRYSRSAYDDDEWMVAGKYYLLCHMSSVSRLSGLY